MPSDIFISYSTRDTETAQTICSALETAGLSCWIAPRNITPGQTWSEAIIDGINGSKVLVLLYTAASNASPQVLREVERAVSKRLGLIAVRLEDAAPSKSMEYLVSVSHWLEAHSGSIEVHLPTLAQSVQSLLATKRGAEQHLSPSPHPISAPPVAPVLPSHNLPPPLTSFIGREKQIQEVKDCFSSFRLVTLVGTGGVGKTRLALKVAEEVLPLYPDGVWLVDYAALTESSLVPQKVAQVLGVKEQPGQTVEQTLLEFLQDKRLLLLLDNCEHLLTACTQLTTKILLSCRQVRLLATSREVFSISGEQPYRVPSLSLPDPKRIISSETLSQYEASQLFVERATVFSAAFSVSATNAPVLASVCHRLDGIPLAIELAAARVRGMPIEEIHSRLDDRFRLLTGGSRTALPRQQTLRALMDWSYDLLNDQEKTLLHRLSVFADGWTLEAAEKVCSCGEGIEDFEVLDLLLSLADKSLVVYEEQSGRARYRMLETVCQYARERLELSAEGAKERHRDYFLALAEEAKKKLDGLEQAEWLEVLETEHDNLRQALTFCLEEDKGVEKGLRLGAALQQFWWTRGYWTEGREHLTALLGHPQAHKRTKDRAVVLYVAAVLAGLQGDYSSARSLTLESLVICRELGEQRGVSVCLYNLGTADWEQGYYESARSLLEESLAIERELGDSEGVSRCLLSLGIVSYEQADFNSARSLLVESLAINRQLGKQSAIAYSLDNLGIVAIRQHDLNKARSLLEECLDIRRKLRDRAGIALSLNNLSNVYRIQGDYASARDYQEESLAIRQEIGDRRGIAHSLEECATLAAAQGLTERAVREWGAAERLREDIGSPLSPNDREEYDRALAVARETLGKEEFSTAWAEGRAMTMEQAIAYALSN